jgi:hypothetical protein
MQLIYQGSSLLDHISTKASKLSEIIERRVRDRESFVIFQGEESCQRASINAVSLGFLSL